MTIIRITNIVMEVDTTASTSAVAVATKPEVEVDEEDKENVAPPPAKV